MWNKRAELGSIKKERVRDRRDTEHNQIHNGSTKTKFVSHLLQKNPFNPIIRLTHVELKSHECTFTLGVAMNEMIYFVSNKDIISNQSAWDKSRLSGGDNMIKVGF